MALSVAERLKAGDLFLIYMLNYAIGRFLLDFLRLDASLVGGVNFNPTAMVIVALGSCIALAWRHKPVRLDPRPTAL